MHVETHVTRSNRIEINPEIMLGKPVIRGTRVTVELLLRKLSQGATEKDLLEAYPHLTSDDIKAAIGYAADTVAQHRTSESTAPARRKPQTGLFKGPGGSTGRLIGEADEPTDDSGWHSS